MKTILTRLVIFYIALYLNCTTNNIAGNSTQTGNPTIVGILYCPDGKTPAKRAKVTLRNKNSLADTAGILVKRLALSDSATAMTNDSGKFVIDSVDTGTYVIVGTDGGNNLALNDSVPVKSKDSVVTLPPDTLKPAGALKGVIRLSEGGDPRKVFILAFGIDRFARVNADGSFKFATLAEGKYDLRVISSLDNYGVLDIVNIPVGSGDTLNMDSIVLPFTGIPTPKNVSIKYDTLKQIVTLSWSKPDSALVKGLNVYRRNVDSNSVLKQVNTSPITDTLYRDSTGIQDQTYEYRVSAIDKNATEGVKSAGVSVKIASYLALDTIYSSKGSANSQFDYPADISFASNGDIYIVDYNNNRIQVFDSAIHFKRQFGSPILNKPYKIAIDSQQNAFVAENDTVFKFDSTGTMINKITLSFPIFDIDVISNDLFVLTNGDSITVFSNDGNRKRAWKCGNVNSSNYLVSGNSGEIILNNDDSKNILFFDSLGNNLSAIKTSAYVYSIAFDSPKQRLFSVYLNNSGDSYELYVTDKNNVEIANYQIPTDQPGEGVAIGLHQNGTVFLLFSSTNRILLLKSFLP